ncbi:MAG TPA: AraC family transcriptional regulator [Nevskiaceae bacterium]|nr:AraC family transcriptional regulator [Nevskiaceae bacterium]
MRGDIANAYVGLLYEYLERRGLDPVETLGVARPDPGEHGLGRTPVVRWAELLARAERALGEPALGLQVGALIGPQHLGVLGYVTLSCANLADALSRLRDYERLVYDVNPATFTVGAGAVTLEWGQALGRPGQLVDECALSALVSYARNITASTAGPSEVGFINARPADVAPYERFFGCPVHFECPTTVVVFPLALLGARLRQPDAALCALLDAQARALLARLPRRDDFEARLRDAIAAGLREQDVSLEACARRLHVSTRTLQRRLTGAGTSFQDALDDARHHLAQAWLRDPRLKLAEVAQLLGYSEQSAFTRAYTRWTGQPPRTARARPSGETETPRRKRSDLLA